MSYIVVDFEFNQAYDFENDCPKEYLKSCRFEIIQIGAVKLNENLEIIDKFNVYVKPVIYKSIHPYVKKITSITEEMLSDKQGFEQAFSKFLSFIGTDEPPTFCVWGSCDMITLYRNLSYHKLIKKDLILKYADIQNITANHLKYSKGSSIGLKSATEILEITYCEDDFHDAFNDALYTAKILQKINTKILPIKVFNSKHI